MNFAEPTCPVEYYRQRMQVEREAAAAAASDEARSAHLELAEQYARMLQGEVDMQSSAPEAEIKQPLIVLTK